MTSLENSQVSPDSVHQLIKLLGEEWKNFTSIEIAETLWLAMQIDAEELPKQIESVQNEEKIVFNDIFSSPANVVKLTQENTENFSSSPAPRVNINTTTNVNVLPPHALPVWLADPDMLTDSLSIIQALKPLLQKVDVGIGHRLDEMATVENIARTQLYLPILKPEQEPWFDIILVVDRGYSMHIWQRLVKDVLRIFSSYGAFRDVQVFNLVVNQTTQSTQNNTVQLISKPHRPSHRPSELIDQRGRRIVVILSDCAGKYWWDGTLLPMLQEWGKIMPTVVWQMLPAWMWKRTALGRGISVAISNDIPGVANQQLQTRIQERREVVENINQRLAVPVVTSEVRDLACWSLMVAGDRREVIPGFILPQKGGAVPRSKGIDEIARDHIQKEIDAGSEINFDDAFHQELEAIARQRVQRFLELASPQATRLIMLLAAAPVITMPVVRLIRDSMLSEVHSPLPVAEVFLSGLLLRLPGQEDRNLERLLQEESKRIQAKFEQQDSVQPEEDELEWVQSEQQDLVQYDFVPKVRNILLQVLPEIDTIEVINSISAEVERRWNKFSQVNFRAFLTNPHIEVPVELSGLRSFASVTADILEQLGGDYANFARELRYGSGGVDFLLEDLEYQVHTIIILQPFQFKLAIIEFKKGLFGLGRTEIQVNLSNRQAKYFIENLGNGIQIEMVQIPGGNFMMGAPEDEKDSRATEYSQHQVSISPFYMGKYAVTQAEWQAVAALPQVNRELNPEPSHFKGANRPVEQVSWYDAVEFCDRLSQHTGKNYSLPSEAEWEYACRAGTTTPFHFGETITTDLANYNGTYTYGGGVKGDYRRETTEVGSFGVANAFGLYDMHGNVWEWCLDDWHDNYEGVPTDGSAWLDKNDNPSQSQQKYICLRGGSWNYFPENCRSASRLSNSWTGDYSNSIGFRVACGVGRTFG